MTNDPQEQDAIDTLATVYSDPGPARLLVERAGVPRARIPVFHTPMVFWHRVVTDARNGLLPGGMRPILERAAREFPGNPIFARYARAASSPPASSPPASSSPSTAQAPGPAASTKPDRIHIFLSYSHADEAYREKLETRLKGIGRLIPLEIWHDRMLLPGQILSEEIFKQLEISDVVLLLISPDFIASEYCFSKEMAEALEKYEQNKGLPVPIIIRPEDTWHDHQVGQHLALPTDGKAISKWPDPDDAWSDVSRGLKSLLTNLAKQRGLLPS